MPLAEATERSLTLSIERMKMIERVMRMISQCASTNSPICTAPMYWMFSSMVACGLPPVAHGLIGKRGKHAAMHDADVVAVLVGGGEAE
jgi:hypothetical protein